VEGVRDLLKRGMNFDVEVEGVEVLLKQDMKLLV